MKFTKRFLSMFLVAALLIGMMPAVFAEDENIDYPGSTANVTENYIDQSGNTIADSNETTGEAITAPEIDGYVYSSYIADISYVYSADDYHHRYINGYPDGTVRAEGNITRAEAVQMLYNLFGTYFTAYVKSVYDGDLAALALDTEDFSDVQPGIWYYNAIKTLYSMGLVSGYDDGTFRPDEAISRSEYAVLVSFVDQLDEIEENAFSDVAGHWAAGLINAAAAKGWLHGYEDGTFRPDEYITRAEAVTLANAVMGRVTNAMPSDFVNPYSDIEETHWAYVDMMESSDTHEASSWHESGDEGIPGLNMITEKFVDQDGNEIAETVTLTGDELNGKDIDGYSYAGYLKVITYKYEVGASPSVEKTASVSTARAGDEFYYTITVSNEDTAEATWKNAVATDTLPSEVTYIDYESADDVTIVSNSGSLTIYFGDLLPGESKSVKINVRLNDNGVLNTTILNTVTATGDNIKGDVTDTDDGVKITGEPGPYASKTASVETAEIGDEFSYTITLGNNGGRTWDTIVVTDVLPETLEYVDHETRDWVALAQTGQTLTMGFGNIQPGEEKSIVITVRVTDSAEIGEIIKNVISISPGGSNGKDLEVTDDGVTIYGQPNPVVTKMASTETAKIGDQYTYTITASNSGEYLRTWTNATGTDTLPAGLSYVSYESSDGVTVSADGQDLSMAFGDIACGETKAVKVTVEVNSGAVVGELIENTVEVSGGSSGSGDDIYSGEATDPGVRIYGDPNPVVEKTASVESARVGDEYTYTITAGNSGEYLSTWTGVTGTDVLPNGVTYVSYESVDGVTASADGQMLTIDFGDIACGETKAVNITVEVNSDAVVGELIENKVVVTGGTDGSDDTFSGEDTEPGVMIYGDPNPAVTKTASVTSAKVGDEYSYTITASNLGEYLRTWTNVTGSDVLPDGVTYVSYESGDGVTASADGQTLTISFGDIACGETKSVKITVKVNSSAAIGELIENKVEVIGGSDGSGDETFGGEDTDPGVLIYGDPNPAVTKTASVTSAKVGDTYSYTITASNSGNKLNTWTGVKGTDALPNGVTYVSYESSDGVTVSADGQTLTIGFGDIACGSSKSVTITVQINNNAVAGDTIKNTVVAAGDNGDSTDTDDGVTVLPTEPVVTEPDPSITKAASVSTANIGSRYTYTINVSNSGSATGPWTNVVLTDELDQFLTFVADSVTVDGVSATATYASRTITINLGDIAPGVTKTVTFDVIVRSDASGVRLYNTAVATGNNGTKSAKDNGVDVPLDNNEPISDIFPIVMNGYDDGTFRPTDTLERSEAVVMLYRILAISTGNKYTVTNTAANAFSDVTADKFYYEALDYLVTSGVISTATGTFRPEDPVARSEYCSMFAKALNLTYSGSYSGSFTDLTSSHWAYSFVMAVLEKGWIDANGSTFDPDGFILRQDAARLVCNAQPKRMEVFASIPTSLYPSYSDLSSSHGYYNYIMAVGISTDYVFNGGLFEYAG